MTLTHEEFERSVSELGKKLEQPMSLGEQDSVGLQIGIPPVEVVLEWSKPGECVAVHAAFSVPADADNERLPETLLRSQLAGAGTLGCAFWMLPDSSLRVGVTLVGPTLGWEALLEAAGRVAALSAEVDWRVTETMADGGDTE